MSETGSSWDRPIPDGCPACGALPCDWSENPAKHIASVALRDDFAGRSAAAMVGTIADDFDYERIKSIAASFGMTSSQWIAREAYKQADALIAARQKP